MIQLKVDNRELRRLLARQIDLNPLARDLEARIKDAAPVDSGRLRDSIKVEVDGNELNVRGARYGVPLNVDSPHRHFVDDELTDNATMRQLRKAMDK